MTFNEYQETASKTAVYPGRGAETGIMHAALGLNGESGEVAEKIKKMIRDNPPNEEVRENIRKELGDVLWYSAELASQFSLTLEEIAEANVRKLSSRQERSMLRGSSDDR